jgi:hypothetical protein
MKEATILRVWKQKDCGIRFLTFQFNYCDIHADNDDYYVIGV